MKAVILARGLGTRMRAADDDAPVTADQDAAASTGVKALVPVAGRPFLDYVLSALADAGCSEVCLVIGPEHDAVRRHYDVEAPPRRLRVRYAIQDQPLGTGHALLSARDFAAADEFLMLNSDNYYPVADLRRLVELGQPGTVLFEAAALAARSNIEPSRILAFALGRVGADGALETLVEKPDPAAVAALGDVRLVSMNVWRFPPAIFDACRELKPSIRGELELTDAINATIAAGVRYRVLTSEAGVLDLSRRADIASVHRSLSDVVVDL